MRYCLLFIALQLGLKLCAQSCKPESIPETEALSAAGILSFKSVSASQGYDVSYYRLNVYLDPRFSSISGRVDMHFTAVQSLLTLIELDLVTSMKVDSVKYHGTNCFFQQEPTQVLQVYLPSVLNLGEHDSISIWYHGQPVNSGLGSFSSLPHASGNAVWSLSQPYGSREWWPAKMSLDDKADSVDVIITSPAQYRGASSGMLVSDTVIDTLRTVHWKHRYPIATYLVAVAASNYAVYSDYWVHQGDSLQILNYVYPHNLITAMGQTPYTASCMELYSQLFEDYPFRKERYGHAQFGRGGGMEHQTMSFMSNFSQDLIAHELAHQWFGDKVTCGSWRDIWLNEGFATYLTGLTYEHFKGDSLWRYWKRFVVDQVCFQPGGSVYPTDTTNVFALFDGRLTYNKGAFVLHMLRYLMGDQKFFSAVQAHLKDSLSSYGFSTTGRFRQHMENSYGKSLKYFFDQWYYGEGYPTYITEWRQTDDQLTLNVTQVTSHNSVSFFQMPLQYYAISKKGKDSLLLTADHTQKSQRFSFTIPFKADTVVFDPFVNILSKGNRMVNLEELGKNSRLHIYPNPVKDVVKISFRDASIRNPKLQLYDVLGRKVAELQLSGNPFIYEWDLRPLSDGFYTVRVLSGQSVLSLPLILQGN
jgi:aminopeptidase N